MAVVPQPGVPGVPGLLQSQRSLKFVEQVNSSEIEEGDILGKGSFGVVLRARWKGRVRFTDHFLPWLFLSLLGTWSLSFFRSFSVNFGENLTMYKSN